MRIDNVNRIVPQQDSVIVEIKKLDAVANNIIEFNNSTEDIIHTRIGEVISKGPDVVLPQHCSTLNIGDLAIFSEFAGHHIVNMDGMYKVIRGYDIIGITKSLEEMNKFNVTPTANRLLLESVSPVQNEDDLILLEGGSDPRQSDMIFGKVLSIGPDVSNSLLKVGMFVAYPPYVGTIIKDYESEDSKELKMIVEDDILLTVS